jgi:hypothetical protein
MKRAASITCFLLAVGTTAAVAAVLPAVLPMSVNVYRDQTSQALAIRFSGRMPASATDERVTLLMKTCSSRFYRQISGTRTRAGGTWELTVGGGSGGFGTVESGAAYRARWKDRLTQTFTFRTRLAPGVTRTGPATFRAEIYTGFGTPLVDLGGKSVLLQRLVDGRYLDVRPLRLRLIDARTFRVNFTVTGTGQTMRVLLPTTSARPCYNASASNVFQT